MYAIRAGAAFDGERRVPGGALVLIDGNRIVGVEPGGAPAPEGCSVLECPASTILPGLIDAHVHLCADGTDGTLDRLTDPGDDALAGVIERSLAKHLAAGVTTVRDLGDRHFAVVDRRASLPPGGGYPTVVASGPPITSVGGHCASMGGAATGPAQLRAAVRERAEHGVDVIKVMASGGFATPGTEVMLCQFERDEVQAVVDESHAAGLPVTAHAHGLPAVHLAMAAGVDGIEHCSFLTDTGLSQSEDDLARLAAARTAVCPTPGFLGRPQPTVNAAALMRKLGVTFEQVIEINKQRVGRMHAAGVNVVSGSDGGISAAKPHGLLPASVAFLVDGGISTAAALASATSLAATACGLGHRTGRLRAGFDADVLVVHGDALDDICALTRVDAVFTSGQRAREPE